MGLSLEKKSELVRLSLEKRQVPAGIKMAVKSVIDVSGSIRGYFDNGTMQELVDRLIPVALRFDDNGSLDSYAFGSDIKKLSDITASDFGNYIGKKFLREVPSDILWSGTRYATALKRLIKDGAPSGGFLGFGKKEAQPTYIKFITDGDTQGDHEATDELLASMKSKKTYVQFIGVGTGTDFAFLNNMAKEYDHVGFVNFPDLARTTDEQLYEQLLGAELCEWIKVQ